MRTWVVLLTLAAVLNINAQDTDRPKPIHQQESEYYSQHPEQQGGGEDGAVLRKRAYARTTSDSLTAVVYGFHPYWISDATALGYEYDLLSHVAYFSAEVDTALSRAGNFSTTRSWSTTQVVNYARENGKKVHLTITMFDKHERVLTDPAIRQKLINNIIAQLNVRTGDGVNIDFESMSSADAAGFRAFINELGTALHNAGKELAICLPAVDWSNVFSSTFFSTNSTAVDYYFLMAYDYYWRGSSTAGPIAPLTRGMAIQHVMRSIDKYISLGLSRQKLISGFPYYGFDWPVESNARMSKTTASGSSKIYSVVSENIKSIPASDKFFDATYNVPWYRYQSGTQWHQVWFDDSLSLSMKYDSIKTRGVAGTGMWALSYDGSKTELWGAIRRAYAVSVPGHEVPEHNHIIASFEGSAVPFDKSPTYSGSTSGIATASTSALSTEQAFSGSASLKLVLKDNTSSVSPWVVRFVSGGGTVSNNTPINTTGYIGFWMKTSTAPAGATVSMLLDDAAGGTEGSQKLDVNNDGQWHLYQWEMPGGGWTSFASGNGVINGPTVTMDAIRFDAPDNPGDWTLYIDDVSYNNSSLLPVELELFTTEVRGRDVTVKWGTATEVNSYLFELERMSPADRDFRAVAWIPAAGNSHTPLRYEFTDRGVKPGRHLYRLKTIDMDGSYEYSGAIEAVSDVPREFTLMQNYPNPFNPVTNIGFILPSEGAVTLRVYDVLGREVAVLADGVRKAGYNEVSFNAAGFPSGTYIYELRTNEYKSVRKMVILK